MSIPSHMVDCLICDKSVKRGPDQYDGEWLPRYKIYICSTCYAGYWDGYVDAALDRVMSHLKEHKLPIPPLNKKGNLPRE